MYPVKLSRKHVQHIVHNFTLFSSTYRWEQPQQSINDAFKLLTPLNLFIYFCTEGISLEIKNNTHTVSQTLSSEMKPFKSGSRVLVALIALGTSNREHMEMLVPHHTKTAGCRLHKPIDYPCFPQCINPGLGG